MRTTGIPESTLAERMGEIEREIAPLTLAYLPGLDGVDLRLTAWRLPPDEADRRLAPRRDLLRERGGEHVYGEGDADLAALVLEAARSRRAPDRRGRVVHRRTRGRAADRDSGQLRRVLGGVVAYDNALKTALLGVPPALIEAHGAVSEAVALAMAERRASSGWARSSPSR